MKRLVVLLYLCCLAAVAQAADSRGLPDFADLVEKYGNTVVNISTTQVVRQKPC